MTRITEVCSNGFKGKRARFESVARRVYMLLPFILVTFYSLDIP